MRGNDPRAASGLADANASCPRAYLPGSAPVTGRRGSTTSGQTSSLVFDMHELPLHPTTSKSELDQFQRAKGDQV